MRAPTARGQSQDLRSLYAQATTGLDCTGAYSLVTDPDLGKTAISMLFISKVDNQFVLSTLDTSARQT